MIHIDVSQPADEIPRPPRRRHSRRRTPFARTVRGTEKVLGRSLFPFSALALILGTLLWGPWVTLVLTFTWWRVVARIA